MAITKTTSILRVEVYPASDPDAADTLNAGNPIVMAIYEDIIDDPDDDDLPQPIQRVKRFERYSDETDGTATVITGENQLVIDVCNAVWS